MPREVTHLLVAAVYHPHKAKNFDLTDYLTTTMDLVTCSHSNAGILLLGDFNQLPDAHLKSYHLQQVVTTATRGKSLLDKIFTSVSTWYQPPVVLPAVTRSDHETVLFLCVLSSWRILLDQLNQLRSHIDVLTHITGQHSFLPIYNNITGHIYIMWILANRWLIIFIHLLSIC